MKKYVNVAKGNFVFVKKEEEVVEAFDFDNEVEVDRVKYLVGNITSMGRLVDVTEFEIGMKIRCAAFVAIDIGNGEYGLNADDIIGEIKEVEEDE